MSRISCSSTSVRDVSGRREPAPSTSSSWSSRYRMSTAFTITASRRCSVTSLAAARRVQADRACGRGGACCQRQLADGSAAARLWRTARGPPRSSAAAGPALPSALRGLRWPRRRRTADRQRPGRRRAHAAQAAPTGAWCTRARSSSPVSRRLDWMMRAASRSCSTNSADCAPRLSASMPSPPEPANRSSTRGQASAAARLPSSSGSKPRL